jgi:LDH2 family malate/lactate/ureidoglycolate dehydrogenase
MSDTYYFPLERLQQAIHDLCRASGSPEEEAELVARRLIKADLTGHPSHGVIRVPRYMEMIRGGLIKPGSTTDFLLDHGSTALITGNGAYGQVAAEKAMSVAIERGRAHGISAVGVTDLAHIGRLADYAVSAARANCIGMVFTACGGTITLVAPFEGSSRRMATNPMAVAMPSDREYPIVFDMATSVYAEGKLKVMQAAGRSSPEQTIIDKEGRPTTRPDDFYEGGAILPLGGKQGYKGYLLNFMVEVLAGVLTGGGCIGRKDNPIFNNCTLMIVIDVERFRELPQFKQELEGMITYLKESPVLEDKEVLYPGEVEARREADVLKTGIPLAAETVKKIQEEMDTYKVSVTLTELGRLTPLS